MGIFGNAGNALANWVQTDQAPIVLGQAAQALMGEHKDSIPAMLGKVGSDLGQSSLMNKAIKEQQAKDAAQRKMIYQALAGMPGTGVGMTPKGTPGDTTSTIVTDGEGNYTKTVKGEKGQPNQMTGGEKERSALAQPIRAQPEVGRSDWRALDAKGLVPLL